jgi:6-phosphogluconolactonase (cycloisomerase 2 family)
VLDVATSHVISYNIASGKLTEVGSYVVPAAPITMAVSPKNAYLYVSTNSGIYMYTISAGTLTLGNSSQPIVADAAQAMAVDSSGAWLVETSGSGTLNAVPLVTTTGLPATSPVCTNNSVICSVTLNAKAINGIAFAPSNAIVAVAAGTNGTAVYTFTAGNANPFSTVATIAPVSTSAGSSLAVAVDPGSRLLYVGEAAAISGTGGGLRAFTIASGALTEISGSPLASGGTGPHAILPKASGNVVYVANWNGTGSGNVTGFSVTSTSGVYSLAKLNSVATGVQPSAIAEDNLSNFVLVENAGGSPYLDAYFFDTTTPSTLDLTITDSSFAGTALAAEN